MANIGRNDPCACGSGKKYKRCCYLAPVATLSGRAAVASGAVSTVDDDHKHHCDFCSCDNVDDEIDDLADRALDLLLEGHHHDAEVLCHQLMRDFPHEVEGIDLLAMVCEARGERQRALELLREAIAIADSHPDFDAETRSMMYERQLELEAAPLQS